MCLTLDNLSVGVGRHQLGRGVPPFVFQRSRPDRIRTTPNCCDETQITPTQCFARAIWKSSGVARGGVAMRRITLMDTVNALSIRAGGVPAQARLMI